MYNVNNLNFKTRGAALNMFFCVRVVQAEADSIDTLEKYRGKCEPTFLFYGVCVWYILYLPACIVNACFHAVLPLYNIFFLKLFKFISCLFLFTLYPVYYICIEFVLFLSLLTWT